MSRDHHAPALKKQFGHRKNKFCGIKKKQGYTEQRSACYDVHRNLYYFL